MKGFEQPLLRQKMEQFPVHEPEGRELWVRPCKQGYLGEFLRVYATVHPNKSPDLSNIRLVKLLKFQFGSF